METSTERDGCKTFRKHLVSQVCMTMALGQSRASTTRLGNTAAYAGGVANFTNKVSTIPDENSLKALGYSL